MGSKDSEKYPLYASTFTIYSLSPLYHGSSLLNNLAVHSRRLRELVTGDALRGAQLSADISGLSTPAPSGAFKSISWDLLGDEDAWLRAHPAETEDAISTMELTTAHEARGICIEVRYEKATHTAILLGDKRTKLDRPGFTDLPLLLIRMPAALKDIFTNYLATAFDARVSPLKLRSEFVASAIEMVLRGCAVQSAVDVSQYPRGCSLQLAFPLAVPQLKSMQVELRQDDLLEFLKQGQTLWNERRSQEKSFVVGPFTAALEKYLMRNLALDLNHPGVLLAKVSLGPFALSNEGKIKVLESSDEAQMLWDMLLEEVQRSSLKIIEQPGNGPAANGQRKGRKMKMGG